MKIIITGGAGFIGSHLAQKLLKEENQILIVDNFDDYYDPKIKRRNIENVRKYNSSVLLKELDIRDKNTLERIWSYFTPDIVVHLAARAGVRPSLKDPLLYHDVNVQATINLLELAKEYSLKKFIFGSSSSVYGVSDILPFSEDNPLDKPISPYAVTKIAGEKLCKVYADVYNIPAVCLRFFTVYGPRQRPEMAIHKFVRMIMNDQTIPVFGQGESARDYTYIDDIIDGILASTTYETKFDIFNLGDSRTVKLMELIKIIESTTSKQAKIDYQPEQPGDVPITYADISKAGEKLGYKPKIPIEEGINRFVDWYKKTNK